MHVEAQPVTGRRGERPRRARGLEHLASSRIDGRREDTSAHRRDRGRLRVPDRFAYSARASRPGLTDGRHPGQVDAVSV